MMSLLMMAAVFICSVVHVFLSNSADWMWLIPHADASTSALVLMAVALGAFFQSISGFGIAVVITSPLCWLMGLQKGRVLVAFITAVVEVTLLIPIRREVSASWREHVPLVAASLCTAPIGLWLIDHLSPANGSRALGVVLVVFTLYRLTGYTAPVLSGRHWTWIFGGMSGVTAGAFNINGPPLVIYAQLRNWDKNQIRINLLSTFAPLSFAIIALHMYNGAVDVQVICVGVCALPGMLFGQYCGTATFHRINQAMFDHFMNVMMITMGVAMCLNQE